jgi:hypothetical protein
MFCIVLLDKRGMAVPIPAVAAEGGETWTAAILLLYYNGG